MTYTKDWREVKLKNVASGRYIVHKNGSVLDLETYELRNVLDNGNGYKLLTLVDSRYGQTRNFYLHRVVAHEFCEGYAEYLEVNHINENKEDNRAENLEWVTSKQNTKHSIGTGRVNGQKRGSTKQTTAEHREFIAKKLCGNSSIADIANALGLPRQTVSSIVNGRSARKDMISLIENNVCSSSSCRCRHYLEVLKGEKNGRDRFSHKPPTKTKPP